MREKAPPYNHILDYHQRVFEKDPVMGRELARLNANHIKRAMGMEDDGKLQVPVGAVRRIKKNLKKNKKNVLR